MATFKYILEMEIPDMYDLTDYQVGDDLRTVLERGFVEEVKIQIKNYEEKTQHVSNLVRRDILETEESNPCIFELMEIY